MKSGGFRLHCHSRIHSRTGVLRQLVDESERTLYQDLSQPRNSTQGPDIGDLGLPNGQLG